MPIRNILRHLALPLTALAVHAAEPADRACDCACESKTSGEAMTATNATDDYSRIGVRYVEAYGSVTKRNHDRLSSINSGVGYSQPVATNLDAGAFYSYGYLQDYTWVHANTLGAQARYHRTYGKLKPFAGAEVGSVWDSLFGRYAYWAAFVGAEYQPVSKLVLTASASMSDTFTSGDNHGFGAGASATYWITPYAGPYVGGSIYEHGLLNGTLGVAARYRF